MAAWRADSLVVRREVSVFRAEISEVSWDCAVRRAVCWAEREERREVFWVKVLVSWVCRVWERVCRRASRSGFIGGGGGAWWAWEDGWWVWLGLSRLLERRSWMGCLACFACCCGGGGCC